MLQVRPVHTDQVHTGLTGPSDDRSGTPVDWVPPVDHDWPAHKDRGAAAAPLPSGSSRVPDSVPTFTGSIRLDAWEGWALQAVLLNQKHLRRAVHNLLEDLPATSAVKRPDVLVPGPAEARYRRWPSVRILRRAWGRPATICWRPGGGLSSLMDPLGGRPPWTGGRGEEIAEGALTGLGPSLPRTSDSPGPPGADRMSGIGGVLCGRRRPWAWGRPAYLASAWGVVDPDIVMPGLWGILQLPGWAGAEGLGSPQPINDDLNTIHTGAHSDLLSSSPAPGVSGLGPKLCELSACIPRVQLVPHLVWDRTDTLTHFMPGGLGPPS